MTDKHCPGTIHWLDCFWFIYRFECIPIPERRISTQPAEMQLCDYFSLVVSFVIRLPCEYEWAQHSSSSMLPHHRFMPSDWIFLLRWTAIASTWFIYCCRPGVFFIIQFVYDISGKSALWCLDQPHHIVMQLSSNNSVSNGCNAYRRTFAPAHFRFHNKHILCVCLRECLHSYYALE